MATEELTRVQALLKEHERRYRNSATRWKFSYRLLLLLSAFFSGSAAIVAKLNYYKVPGARKTPLQYLQLQQQL